MANTVISLKYSKTPGSIPASLANGEIAINMADEKLYFMNANGAIVEYSGHRYNFGTINVGGSLLVSDQPGDILSISSGNNIILSADTGNDSFVIEANITPAFTQANNANITAVGAFLQANNNNTTIASAYSLANTVNTIARNASTKANGATQTAFSYINVSGTLITAPANNSTLTLVAGNNVTLSSNTVNNTILINSTATGGSGNSYTNSAIQIFMDGQGQTISNGALPLIIQIPFNCTIKASRIYSVNVGKLSLDVWYTDYSHYPPTSANSIVSSSPPTLSGANKNVDSTLTGWTTSLSKGGIITCNVSNAVNISKCTVVLEVDKV